MREPKKETKEASPQCWGCWQKGFGGDLWLRGFVPPLSCSGEASDRVSPGMSSLCEVLSLQYQAGGLKGRLEVPLPWAPLWGARRALSGITNT